MRISHNLSALSSYNALTRTDASLEKTLRKLSTGLRINSAADDAAGLAISEKMRAQIRGLDMATRNAEDGVSMLQTMEGALAETHDILQRMRELAVQAANDTLTQQDRSYIQSEIDQLKEEITRIANTTQFNKKRLLDGSAAALWSSSDLATRAIIRGSIREIDQFGQKSAAEGNYKIQIHADPGRAEAQKSSIFVIKHENVLVNVSLDPDVEDIYVDELPPGTYTVTQAAFLTPTAALLYNRGSENIQNIMFSISNYSTTAWDTNPTTTAVPPITLTVQSVNADGSVTFAVDDGRGGGILSSTVTLRNTTQNVRLGIGTDGREVRVNMGLNGVSLSNFVVGFTLEYGAPAVTPGTFLTPKDTMSPPGSSVDANGLDGTDTPGKGPLVSLAGVSDPLDITVGGTVTLTVTNSVLSGTVSITSYSIAVNFPGAGGSVETLTGTLKSNTSGTSAQVTLANGQVISINYANLNPKPSTTYTGTILEYSLTPRSPGTGTLDTHTMGVPEQNNREQIRFDVANAPGDGRVLLKIIDKDETAGSEKLIARATFTREDGATETLDLDLLAGGTVGTVLGDFTFGPGTVTSYNLVRSFAVGDELEYIVGQLSQTRIVGHYGDLSALSSINFRASPETAVNASVLMTVENVDAATGTIRVRLQSSVLRTDGTAQSRSLTVTLAQGGTQTQIDASLLGFAYSYNIDAVDLANIHVGDKLTYNITGSSDDADSIIVISGSQTPDWPQNWIGPDGGGVTDLPLRYAVNTQQIQGKTVGFRNFYINSKTGEVYDGTVNIKFNASGTTGGGTAIGPVTDGKTLGSFEATYVGQEAQGDVKLRDLNRFWDAQGVFMLTDPQTITLTQGDGRRVGVTLYSGDTLEELRRKLDEAISFGLGQGKYLPGPEARFVSFVEDPEEDSLESVRGTFVIRSVIAGEEGRISFAGSENLLNALGLNVIQEAAENDFTVTISDAHSGNIVVSGVKVTGSTLVGVLHPNVDVAFDPMANVEAEWDGRGRSFRLLKEDELYETFLHIADSGTVLQIGANEGEDAAVDVGNMSAEALGVLKVTVTDRESAARGITIVDNAIDRVSKQRAKIGAFQNRLEHTISNLVVAGTNMTASESRIRDADMAQTAMNMARLQILSQAGTSMLAQANLIPRNVLSLIQ